MAPQRHARAVQLGLGGTYREAEHVGNLLVAVALDVVKHEHLPGAGRKPVERSLEIERDLRTAAPARHRFQHVIALQKPVAPHAQRLAPGQNYVDAHPVQPGRERGLAPIGAELLPGANEDVLGDFIRIVIVQAAQAPSSPAAYDARIT